MPWEAGAAALRPPRELCCRKPEEVLHNKSGRRRQHSADQGKHTQEAIGRERSEQRRARSQVIKRVLCTQDPSASEGFVWMARRPAAALWARPCPDMLSAYFDLEMMVGGISQPSLTPVLLIETQNHNEGKLLKEGIADKSVFRCTLTVNGKSGMPRKEDLEDRQSIFAGWLGRSNENIQGSGWSKRETRRLTRLPLERQNIL
ncbi:hypothetical protein K438DRAFT_1758831 [Mycena galopus ATCC 62051]|nr:hypothetical protein K438DRAFT_1758831 [Mycena galopus ATCC 62051]